jgi:magnesium and cobalt transporter
MNSDERSLQENSQNHSPNIIDRIVHLLKGEPNDKEELADIISDASERDIIDETTHDMLTGVFEISELKVRDIMIPRSQMNTIFANETVSNAIKRVIASGHSRYPVIQEDKDHIEGILLAKDLLKIVATEDKKEEKNIHSIIRPAVVVPESKRVDSLLKDFQQCRYHMAIVVDEYGGVSGLVTIEDILELIVGEIEDEYDSDEINQNITEIGENLYNIHSLTSLEEFNEMFKCEYSDEEYDTIGGLVMHYFGHLPSKGDSITIDNLEFKVLSATKRCTNLLQMKILPKVEE